MERIQKDKNQVLARGMSAMQVAQLMGNQAVVQRKLVEFNNERHVAKRYNALDVTTIQKMNSTANMIDRYVERAHGLFQEKSFEFANPSYVDTYQKTNSAASIGYIIESIATNLLIKDGMLLKEHFQWTSGHGRPDVAFVHAGATGIVDITSDAQSGHVLNKEIDWDVISYVAESQYPNFSGMVSRIVKKKCLADMEYMPSDDEL